MAQEFTINSTAIESKINQLLPSQGGFGAGVDFSASTMVIPIVDLTESAEGSDVREDLQTALSLNTVTFTSTTNATATIINNTGYFRIFGTVHMGGGGSADIKITDGTTTKILLQYFGLASQLTTPIFDFVVFLPAGVSVTQTTSSTSQIINTTTRQIADVSGNLVQPT